MTTPTTAAPASATIPRTTPAPGSRPTARLRVTGAELTRLVGAVLPFADDPDTAAFPLLTNVQLLVHHDPAGAWLYVAATNRYCLGVARVRLDEDTDPMPAGTTWEVTVPARELALALTGTPAGHDLDLTLDPDSLTLTPVAAGVAAGVERRLRSTAEGFPRWPFLLLTHATSSTGRATSDLTPRYVSLLTTATRYAADQDLARLLGLTTESGHPALVATLADLDTPHTPWFLALVAGRLLDKHAEPAGPTPFARLLWPELTDLDQALEQRRNRTHPHTQADERGQSGAAA